MVAAGLVGAALTIALVRQADAREEIAVASHALTPGTAFSEDDVRWTRARLDGDVPALRRGDLAQFEGMLVTGRVAEGEIISSADFRPPATGDGRRAVSIPIDRARAVNGELAPGDRVDVVLAGDSEVEIIVAAAEVLDVHDDRSGTLGAGVSEFSVTLAATAGESQLLAAAITDGDILMARSTGAPSAEDTPPLPISSKTRR